MNRKHGMAVAALGVFGIATSSALAGYKVSRPVTINTVDRTASGSLGDARGSADTNAYIGCAINYVVGGTPVASCSARDAAGVIGSCSTSDPSLLKAALNLDDEGYLYLRWYPSGACWDINAGAGHSAFAPKLQ